MRGNHRSYVARAIVASLALAGFAYGQGVPSLEQGFRVPPESAKPRVWWHWTGGNVTKEGITKDLEWMKRVGIGGGHMADIGQVGGQTIETPLTFFTPEWFDALKHAAAETDRLGLEMTMFSSSGWSITGGPWVKPEEAMKKLVWSETNVEGPKKFSERLVQPPSNNGTFGSLRGLGRGPGRGAAAAGGPAGGVGPAAGGVAAGGGGGTPGRAPGAAGGPGRAGPPRGGPGGPPVQTYYGDSAVIAFRTPSDEMTMEELNPRVTSSAGAINGAAMMDDVIGTSATIAAGADGAAWVQYEFAQPIKVRAVTLIASGRGVPFGQIQVSDDGEVFRPVVSTPGAVQYRPGGLKTYAMPETVAKFVRVRMTAQAPGPDAVIYQTAPVAGQNYQLSEFIVHTGARVDRWEEKAGFNFFYEYQVAPTPAIPSASLIPSTEVVDLTSKMKPDGMLDWDVPAGKWTILRMGYSLTGTRNRAATPAGTGLEVDKMNAKHVESYFKGYMGPIEQNLGPLVGKSLRYLMMDSWEAGSQNWTDDMIAQFKTRRGYDPTPWLPVLAGRVVGSAEMSDRFLWDFRRTIADLIADNHYGKMAELLKAKGMGIYGEAAGVSMEIIEDTLLNKSKVEIPMGEFWLGRMHPPAEYYVDVRMAASAAHIYGKQFVATESFTGGGYDTPATYKNLADYWFAQGVNRLVFHSSAQQPLDTRPGNTMVGTHFNRNITWAEQAGPLLSYFARCQYMLSQGLFVADFAYLLNEGAPSSQPFWGAGLQPTPPEGYDYDTINADVLLNRMKVAADGRLVLPDGMSYRVLVLPQVEHIRPELLKKIKELVAGGAVVVGPKPTGSPSLQGGAGADGDVQALGNEIWGDLDGVQRNKNFYGKGLVTWGLTLPQVLELVNLPKDAEFSAPLDSNLVWIHRRAGDADYYFVVNRTDRAQSLEARFRVAGKAAEIWHPDTGKMEPASYTIAAGRTTIPLQLDPRQSVFVVMRGAAESEARAIAATSDAWLATVQGPWSVAFPPRLGAPEKIEMAQLQSWTEHSEEGVRFFSGTGTYTKIFAVQGNWIGAGSRIEMDLGQVGDIAEVSINGKAVGTLWKRPYRLDVTDAIKPGENQLEIKVTNQWNNRIAGDRGGPAERRILSGTPGRGGFGRGPAAPAPSGLIGPVMIVSKAVHKVESLPPIPGR